MSKHTYTRYTLGSLRNGQDQYDALLIRHFGTDDEDKINLFWSLVNMLQGRYFGKILDKYNHVLSDKVRTVDLIQICDDVAECCRCAISGLPGAPTDGYFLKKARDYETLKIHLKSKNENGSFANPFSSYKGYSVSDALSDMMNFRLPSSKIGKALIREEMRRFNNCHKCTIETLAAVALICYSRPYFDAFHFQDVIHSIRQEVNKVAVTKVITRPVHVINAMGYEKAGAVVYNSEQGEVYFLGPYVILYKGYEQNLDDECLFVLNVCRLLGISVYFGVDAPCVAVNNIFVEDQNGFAFAPKDYVVTQKLLDRTTIKSDKTVLNNILKSDVKKAKLDKVYFTEQWSQMLINDVYSVVLAEARKMSSKIGLAVRYDLLAPNLTFSNYFSQAFNYDVDFRKDEVNEQFMKEKAVEQVIKGESGFGN